MAEHNKKWDDRYYLQAYLLAKEGLTDAQIASRLGASHSAFSDHWKKRPAMKEALSLARDKQARQQTLKEFVHGRLPPELQDLWDRLEMAQGCDDAPARIERLFDDKGESARQHLYLYALVCSNFDPTEACRKLNLPKRQVQQWASESPEFARLEQEIGWHKGNFFESALIQLVKEGEPAAVIHANKTFNRDRGYGEVKKLEKTTKGEVNHTHAHVALSLKDVLPYLSIECKEELLRVTRAVKAGLPPGDGNGKGVIGVQQMQETRQGVGVDILPPLPPEGDEAAAVRPDEADVEGG